MDEIKKEETLSSIMGATGRAVSKKLNKIFVEKNFPFTMEQGAMMHILIMKEEGTIQQDIAEEMEKHKSAILRTLDVLEGKKLVERVSDPKDRRKNVIKVTEYGKQMVEQAQEVKEKVLNELIVGISKEDFNNFIKVLKQIQINAKL